MKVQKKHISNETLASGVWYTLEAWNIFVSHCTNHYTKPSN